MASGGAEEDNGCTTLDIDNMHMLLQVEHEQIQKRTFTNWINAQLAKRCPPSFMSDLFSDLRDGSLLLDLLEVMSGHRMKRQKGHGVFKQRADIETALNFLRKKSVKLVNINIPDVIDGRPSIILGLVWTIILHCHIEELASTLSFSSRHSSLDSLASSDSWSGSSVPVSPVPPGQPSPLHRRFRTSAKKALLMWVRDQCKRVGCSVSVKDFKTSWRSGEAFLAILCALRPQLGDLSLVQARSNQENLEEAFHLAERELHIPRLLEPQDVDVKDPDEKSIMTYVAQFLQYSNDMPAPDDHMQLFPHVQPSCLSPVNLPAHFTPAIAVSPLHQASPSKRAQEVSCWLQNAYQELSETWAATDKSAYAEKYQVIQSLAASIAEQRRPVMTLLAGIRRCTELSQEQHDLRTAWDHLDEELQKCKADLDLSLPPPLVSVVEWLQRAEAALSDEQAWVKDHADAAKEARARQESLKTLCKEMSHQVHTLDSYHNMDDSGNAIVPDDKFNEIKRQLTNIRVTAKYQGIKLEYQESRHTVLELLGRVNAKVQSWKAPYTSMETVCLLLQDWHETVERQGLLLILMDALQDLREKVDAYNSKASLSEDSKLVSRQAKEAESEVASVTQAVTAVRVTMERVLSAWVTYNRCLTHLHTWLSQRTESHDQAAAVETEDISEWVSCQAQLNEAGNLLIEVTESSASLSLAEQLSKVNMQWAECMKRTMFEAAPEPSVGPLCHQMAHSLFQEASWLLGQPLEVGSVPLKVNRQKVKVLSKKTVEWDVSSIGPYPDRENLKTLKEMLAEAERACGELQPAASRLEGRLAELDRWSSEALDCYQHLKEREHRGRSKMEREVKALVSRGMQLENQVGSDVQSLLDLVGHLQKTSPLQHLSYSGIQDRSSETVSHCQEILGLFRSLGFWQPVAEASDKQPSFGTAHQTETQPEAGSFVVVRTKHVDQVGNVKMKPRDANQLAPQIPSQTPFTRSQGTNTKGETIIVIPQHGIQIWPQSAQTVNTGALTPSQNDHLLLALTRAPAGPEKKSAVTQGSNDPSPSQTHKFQLKCRITEQRNTRQSDKTSPQPLVMDSSEVHSKARSMARSRLEKARFRLQGRIQQAIKLFAGKEISEMQAKKKQRALKILQPAFLEEFLAAVDGCGAFCSGSELQELLLLSDSVRKQWEDVRTEMSSFVPILWSKIKLGKPSFSVVECKIHTNYSLHEATDQTPHDSVQQQQAVTGGAASIEERVESLQELCETLAPRKSPCLATDQLKEADEAPETADTALEGDCRGRQLRGNTPLRATGEPPGQQSSKDPAQKPTVTGPKQHPAHVGSAVSGRLRGDFLKVGAQDIPAETEDNLTQPKDLPGPSVRDKEPLTARLLHITESNQQTHVQTVVRGDTVETKQEAEWTIIPETTAPPQEEPSSEQEVLERYRNTCSVFQSQLQKNKLQLELLIPESVTVSTLQNQRKQLQALKQESEALWFDFEVQFTQLFQFPQLMTGEEWSEVERKQKQLTQQWRDQQTSIQTRMLSLGNTAELVESAGDQMTLITEELEQIIRQPVVISSLTLANPQMISDLKDIGDKLQFEMRKLSEHNTDEDMRGPEATSSSSICLPLHDSLHLLELLWQRLERVQSAAESLNRFLATAREVEAEIPTLLPNQDSSRERNGAEWEQERYSWQTAVQQRLHTALEQSEYADSTLKAAGMTLTTGGATVMCWDLATSLSQKVLHMETELMRAMEKEDKKDEDSECFIQGKNKIQEKKEMNPTEMCQRNTGDDSLVVQCQIQEQQHPSHSGMEEESGMQAKKSRLEEEDDTRTQGENSSQTILMVLKAKDHRRRRRRSQVKREGEKGDFDQKRLALIGQLKEILGAAEQLGLQEPTQPALQQRRSVLTRLESQRVNLSELQNFCAASSQADERQTRELEDLWEETTKAVTERLDQCGALTELLKRFQSVRGELGGSLQRAESTINEQVSYMGKDNLQRLHAKVQETKAELNGLGVGIEEVRSTCRQLHIHLREIPECTINPFEGEADALMDHWLDISERTESHLENLHLGLTLWDGVLQLGSEVDIWANNKLALFAESPSFQGEEDIRALQDEIVTQEESMESFYRRATEIQTLLQSSEPPLELQVVETQVRNKIEQLRELVSEAEDVCRQMEATKQQISDRLAECCSSLQRIQDSLLTLSGSDAAETHEKLKDLHFQLQTQDQQAESLLEDLRVMASLTSPESLQGLSTDGIQLQQKVRDTQLIFSEVGERAEKDIQALNRLQKECVHLEQWLKTAEEEAEQEENLSHLQEEADQHRVRAETLGQLVSSLQSSTLQQSGLVKQSVKLLERYRNFQTNVLTGRGKTQSPVSRDEEVLQLKQSCGRDLRQHGSSPTSGRLVIQSPAEQRLHCAHAVESAMAAEGGAQLEDLRLTGNDPNQRLCDGDELKQENPEANQEPEEQWRDLQSAQPGHSVLQAEPELTSSYLVRTQGACTIVQELQHQTAQLPRTFPWPGTIERRQACLLAHQLQDEAESLQLSLISLAEQRRELAEQSSDFNWNEVAESETCFSSLMAELSGVCSRLEEGVCNEERFGQMLERCRHELTFLQGRMSACQEQREEGGTEVADLQALLEEATDMEKDLLQLLTLKDSIAASSTAEAQATLCEDVSNLQNHQMALHSCIRDHLALLEDNSSQRGQQVRRDSSCAQEKLQDQAEDSSGNNEVMSDSQSEQQSCTIQIQGDMKSERTAAEPAADQKAGKMTCESPGAQSYKHGSTMQDILSEIQSSVERSNIINRTPHIDLNWYLESSPGEPEIRLVRTVQKVLACRYQPAQLDVTATAKQLEEAEELKCCLLDQVALINNPSSTRISHPKASKSLEGQWSTALLDASATVQVKAAQLDQVKQYHKQMRIIKAFLGVIAAEKDNMSLNALGSSALQAERLRALLQTVERKKDLLQELLRLSSQLSVHLRDSESSGALLAQLGDVQDDWRLLEGSITRALRHASNSASQSSHLIEEAKHLKDAVETIQKSIQSGGKPHDMKSTLELVCQATDLKLYNNLYLHLQSQSDALVHFSPGQKEKEDVERNLQEVGSLLTDTKSKLDPSAGVFTSAKIFKHFQDLIIRAKQGEKHFSLGKKLSLFPEEARIQIVEMKRFQTDVLTRRSKIQDEVEVIASDMKDEDRDQVLKTIEGLYEAMAERSYHVLDTMKKNLQERETLLCQLANMDAWLEETHATRDPCVHVENITGADLSELESELQTHKSATVQIERQLNLVEAMVERSKVIEVELSPGESRYLVNRLSGLWTELDGLLAHEKATSWELEELIHEKTSSDEELSTIQDSLKQISTHLEQQRFPLTQETLSTMVTLRHMLMEHQCQVQEIQHCQEAKRSSLLCTIGELQDRCKTLSIHAFEQDKYLHLKEQMEESRDIVKEQIQRAKDKLISVGERFRLCQALLVELPLVKTQCQEAADQLEAIAQELNPSQLDSERQSIRCNVDSLVSWEDSVTDDIKHLEAKLLLELRFTSELPAFMEFLQRTILELQGTEPISPDEKSIDVALRRCWVLWRNVESWMRVMEALGLKEKMNLKNYSELHLLTDGAMQECHLHMESLSLARDSLKDYQWAAQGAIGFLLNAEATFLSAPGGFLDCTEEQQQTQQAIEALEEGFQAHICHLVELVPKQLRLSHSKTEQLHISILSQLLVGRAVLEAQAQLRLESLQRCEIRQQSHKSCHEDIRQRISGFEDKLSECAAEQVTSYDKCVAQNKRAELLLEDLRRLAGGMEELRAGCPMHGCGVGKDGELGALWRRWVSLRHGVGLLMAHTEQRGEEWRDITTSMEQCCSLLASLQAEVPDSSTVGFIQEEPQKLLAQALIHQAGLEQEQQALASLEHRLEHALSLTSSQDPISPGSVVKTLVKIQENIRSLKERNLLVVAAAQAEEMERERVEEKIEELERDVFTILPMLGDRMNSPKQQDVRKDLISHQAKLKCIIDSVQSRYAETPADITKRIQELQQSLSGAEEKIIERSGSFGKLARQVVEFGSGLREVKELLEQRSSTVNEAQNALKHVWDELDVWHSRLMLLDSEVQDLAEEQPDQAHLFMDQLTQPLQLYQTAAQMAEHRTAFLSKIPSCLKELEDLLRSAPCWLNEAQAWLSAPCTFTTARSLQNHANSLQLVLEDSQRIRDALQGFRLSLAEISAVIDIRTHEERLEKNDQEVRTMQSSILEPLELLLHAAEVVEAIEAELKTTERNVPKIRMILSSMDNSSISSQEHLHNRQVILANVQSMRRTLEEMESCKVEIWLPQGAEESLVVFSRVRLLLENLTELEHLTQQQAFLLKDKIRGEEGEEGTSLYHGMATSSNPFQEMLHRSPRNFFQEAFEASKSEEEVEEDESCYSSSSDTLTCSTPEDPEATLFASDLQSEDVTDMKNLSDVKALEGLAGQLCSEVDTGPVGAESLLLSATPVLQTKTFGPEDVGAGLTTESRFYPNSEAFTLKSVTTEPLDAAAASQNRVTDPHTASHQAAAAVEDTRLIPARPITPFTATGASPEFREETHGHLRSPTAAQLEHNVARISGGSLVEESQHAQEPSEQLLRLAGHNEEDIEQKRWSQLHAQIALKLSTLKKVQEEHQTLISSGGGGTGGKVPEGELASGGSAAAALQQANECKDMLRQIVSSADDSHSSVKEKLYLAVRRVLLCLDALPDLLLTPRGAGEDDTQLRMLQQECLSGQLVSLSGLLSKVESESRPALVGEPDTLSCLVSLQQCLQTLQLAFTPSQSQISEHLDLRNQYELWLSDEFELGQTETSLPHTEAPSLEQCVLGRHLRRSPGGESMLQKASLASLQGISHLLELGDECITEGQLSPAHSGRQLQATSCRRKKLLKVLRSQLAFVQLLFRREPEALKCQEDEQVQLELRSKALLQKALEQEVASQQRLQEWIGWENNCGQLGRLLDELEAFISSREPEGEDDEECIVQQRLHACQQTLVQLDDRRAALGLLLDQTRLLQAEPAFATSVGHAGGALELRWRSAYLRTEQEVQRCRDIQDSQVRFQTGFASVSKWLVDASEHLQTWSDLTDTSDLNQECVHRNVITLLDFSIEMEGMSAVRASVSRDATKLLHLREAECPALRAHLSELEVSWSRLTSDLSNVQEHLQQKLLLAWPPVKLLSDLEDWLKKQEARLDQERETVLQAKDAAHITKSLQHYQELKASMIHGQLHLDFLSQSGPQEAGEDVRALCSKRTVFAEQVGDLRRQWQHLQRQLEGQVRDAEQILHTCADKEKQLQRLRGSIDQQRKHLHRCKQPTSQTLARRALLEWEADVGRVNEVAAGLQDLKATCVRAEDEEKHPCDVAFSEQAETVSHACADLSQQMQDLKPVLKQTVEEWGRFERNLREVSVHTTRVRCALQHQRAPVFSMGHAEEDMDLLQRLQEMAGQGEELWMEVNKSHQSLLKSLDHGTAKTLNDQMEGERKRWEDLLQELKVEHKNTGETLSLWQEYNQLSESCALRLKHLSHQREELLSSSLSPQRDTQATSLSGETLQDAAEDLQRRVGDVSASSKPLVGRVETLAAHFIQSETRILSRDVLLLSKAMSRTKRSLQEDEEQHRVFQTQLEAIEKQTQNKLQKQKCSLNDKDSAKQELLKLSELFPSLVVVRETSGYVNLSKQETETLKELSGQWIKNVTHMSDMYRELQAESLHSQDFQQKCKNLTSILEKLEQESLSRKPQRYSNLQEILTVHQEQQVELITGRQLLQGLLCDAVESMEGQTAEERSELMTEVTRLKERWLVCVSLAAQHGALTNETLSQRRIYQQGSKRLWKLLRDVDPLLPPAGPALCTVQQLRSCADDCQCVEEALGLHLTLYTQTVEAGRCLCETMTESQSQLHAELRDVEEAWKHTDSLLANRRSQVNVAIQKWSQCQDGITNIMSELQGLRKQLSVRPEEAEEEQLLQKTGLSLQHLASGLRELATMKTDLSQYVAAGDSALLEQQLEQLHGQWEELCMKVSLRRQEIADRLNAWTIFNDKNKEFCDWLTQMENKVCHNGDLSIGEMVEKLKKDCMEEINLFSENKSHLKQLGEQLLLASDEAKQTQVHESLQVVNQRWHHLFHHIEARVKKLKETLVTVQQLDKNMSNLRSWLSRVEAELSRPITYSVCHHQEIQRRLAEQQELQKDIEQHTEGVVSVLSLCDVLLRDEDAAGGTETESDSLQETSRSLDQRWRTICALALDRRLRIEETWRLWCKFLDDYSRFEDWLKIAERTAANPNSADVLYAVAKEELKKFEGFQRQVHERLTHLELVNNQYRRLTRENRTDRASQLKVMVHEGNRRWDTLHRRVSAILRRLKYFTSQREEFEGTRESMLVWLTELDLQLTNVEHFSESDVHHKIQQLSSFQKEITVNTERIDGLIVFGEGLIQRSSPQDAALIEDELEELHSYCQEVFSRLVRFHQRLIQPPITEEPELSGAAFSLGSSLELIGRPWLGRSQGSLPATPSHLLASPLERSGRETPVSVDSLPLEWDHTGDVGGSSSHEEDEEEDGPEEEGAYYSAVSSRSMTVHESPRWLSPGDPSSEPLQLDTGSPAEAAPTLTSTPLKQGYLCLMSQCSGSIEDIKRVSLILDDEEQPEELGLTGLTASDKQTGVIERWELFQARSESDREAGAQEPQKLTADLDDITSWLENVIPQLDRLQQSDPAAGTNMDDMAASAKELREIQKMFTRYKSVMLSVNLRALELPEQQERLAAMNRDWSRACTGLQQWDTSLRKTLMRCQEFHETLHSLLLWLAHAESRRYAVDINHPETPVRALQQHVNTLTELQEDLLGREAQLVSLRALWSQLQPEDGAEESREAQEKIHVTGSKLKLLLRQVSQDLSSLRERQAWEPASSVRGQSASSGPSQEATHPPKGSSIQRARRDSPPPRSFFRRVLRASFPLHLLLLFLLLVPCLVPLSESDHSCTEANNFARSFYPMLHYTNGPPPT